MGKIIFSKMLIKSVQENISASGLRFKEKISRITEMDLVNNGACFFCNC